jgi:type IV secretory pathway VirB3-like protein
MVVIEHSIIFGVPKCLMSIIIIPLKLLVVIYENVKILFLARLVVCYYHLRAVASVFL